MIKSIYTYTNNQYLYTIINMYLYYNKDIYSYYFQDSSAIIKIPIL